MWPMIYQGGYTFKSTQVSRTVKSQARNCWGPMSLSLVLSRSAVCLLLLLPLLLPPPPFLLFSSSPFPQFCHINMNLGLRGFRVPQAASCYVCLVYSSVTMVTDAWVFLVLSVFLCLFSFLALSLHCTTLTSHPQCLLPVQFRVTRGSKSRNQDWKVCVVGLDVGVQ